MATWHIRFTDGSSTEVPDAAGFGDDGGDSYHVFDESGKTLFLAPKATVVYAKMAQPKSGPKADWSVEWTARHGH